MKEIVYSIIVIKLFMWSPHGTRVGGVGDMWEPCGNHVGPNGIPQQFSHESHMVPTWNAHAFHMFYSWIPRGLFQ